METVTRGTGPQLFSALADKLRGMMPRKGKPTDAPGELPARTRTRHLTDPHYPRGFRTMPTLAERVSPRACTCDKSPGRCPWHLGRFSVPPRQEEEHAPPRIHGISAGAWLLFCALYRGVWWALAGGRADYSPGRVRMQRYIGGRNSRTRPLDEHGLPSVGPRYEKGTADPSTVTAYLHELRGARLEDGMPLVATFRHPNAPMSVWIHPDVLHDPDPAYTVRMAWDLGTPVHAPDPTIVQDREASQQYAATSPSSETLSRLGDCTPTLHPENETLASLSAGAQVEPWWADWVGGVGSLQVARRELYRVLRKLRSEGVEGAAVRAVYELLTHQRERQQRAPRNYAAYLLSAARKGWHVKRQTPEERIAARIAEEQRQAAPLAVVPELGPVPPADTGTDTVEAEETPEERARWIEELRAAAFGQSAPPAQQSGPLA